MSEENIEIILSTLITTSGLITTLLFTILVFFLNRASNLFETIRQINSNINDIQTKDKLTLAMEKGLLLGSLSTERKFLKPFFIAIVLFLIVFIISICCLTLRTIIQITDIIHVIYILVFITIMGIIVMFYHYYQLLRYNHLLGEDYIILKSLFHNGVVWNIVHDDYTDDVNLINTQTGSIFRVKERIEETYEASEIAYRIFCNPIEINSLVSKADLKE